MLPLKVPQDPTYLLPLRPVPLFPRRESLFETFDEILFCKLRNKNAEMVYTSDILSSIPGNSLLGEVSSLLPQFYPFS